MKKILFVCHGNICRSPMAEFVMKDLVKKAGREKAIEPGAPADLCRVEFVPIYRKLGRECFMAFCKENPDMFDVKTAKQRLKQFNQIR